MVELKGREESIWRGMEGMEGMKLNRLDDARNDKRNRERKDRQERGNLELNDQEGLGLKVGGHGDLGGVD